MKKKLQTEYVSSLSGVKKVVMAFFLGIVIIFMTGTYTLMSINVAATPVPTAVVPIPVVTAAVSTDTPSPAASPAASPTATP